MSMISKMLHALGSIRFAVYLLLCTAVLLFTGSVCQNIEPGIFVPLNSLMLFDWLRTFGLENPSRTWWFFLLITVLLLLGINTFICTALRTAKIIGLRNHKSIMAMLFTLSPHIMHFAFLILMTGYFVLYTCGINSYNNIMKPGIQRHVPGSDIRMELREASFYPVDHSVNESLKDMHVDAKCTVVFFDGDKTDMRTAGLNRPCFYKGYSIHVADFNPKKAKSMPKDVWINFTIRKNAGIPLFIAGIIIFTVGVLLYVTPVLSKRNYSGSRFQGSRFKVRLMKYEERKPPLIPDL